jgi:hypothetical protein
LFEAYQDAYASVEAVPDQDIRTPLQRAIQVLKRHRDIRFQDPEFAGNRPISILLTTLAAQAYRDETDIYSALEGIVSRIESFDSSRIILLQGRIWRVPNPVNPNENFTDRWNESGSNRAEAFFQWIKWLRQDLNEILEMDFAEGLDEALSPKLGHRAVMEAVSRYERKVKPPVAKVLLPINQSPRLNPLTVAHRQPPIWPITGHADVWLSAIVTRDGWRPHSIESGQEVPKARSITFQLHTNVQGPFDVYWQIVNTGKEAADARNLRGSFFSGGTRHIESTVYRGQHWVQCFLVRNGFCIGKSAEFIVQVG